MRPLFLALFLLLAPALAGQGYVLFAAGDIATCRGQGDEATARLIEQTAPKAAPWAVLALGDLAYPWGTPGEFSGCYHPSWGRFFDRTLPVPGNHDYYTPRAAGYFGYFKQRAHPPRGYYRAELGGWSLYALNTNLPLKPGSAQFRWLQAELKKDKNRCKLAFMHHPRFSSGVHGDDTRLAPLWALFGRQRLALVLAGHDHDYERIEAGGPIQFVVGTGGAPLRRVKERRPGSKKIVAGTHGVLELTLRPAGFRFRFIDVEGRVRDAGEGSCAP